MECSGVIVEKFMKFLTADDTKKDEMKVSTEILRKYGSRIQPSFFLKFRNGYEKTVVFNEETGTFYGLFSIFYDFNLEGGEMLLFEFNGSRDFNDLLIGLVLREIEYPNIVHYMQKKRPRVVSVRNGGLKFVHIVRDEDPLFDECEPPYSFKKALPMLPGYQSFIFSNGKKIVGGYNHGREKFHSLRKFCAIVGLENFREFNVVLFSYEENGVSTVSVFDDLFVEFIFPGTPVSMGLNSENINVHHRIEINVQACHMYKYSYGVILTELFECTLASFHHFSVGVLKNEVA
uniref:Uncharacterized protein n=1 Tax=Daucus carota subsp. sativus TaxID=79200 RepID=A0A162A3Z5_DAUCS